MVSECAPNPRSQDADAVPSHTTLSTCIYGEYSAFHNDYTFKSLKDAMDYTSCRWDGPPHRALSDALACRAVWQWMESKATFNEPPVLMLAHLAS